MKQAVIHTLGCRLNTADSALLSTRLAEAGYQLVEEGESVALVIVNTCTVTGEAGKKSRQAVRRFRGLYPGALIVATGCGAELEREAFQKEGAADLVLSNPEKREVIDRILEALAGRESEADHRRSLEEGRGGFAEGTHSSFPFRTRAFIKIQEGCENFCTYCIVPYARGPERSRRYEEVMEDCRQALAAGAPELVLTGVNTSLYQDSGRDLAMLVNELTRLGGDFRIRLSSTEPHPANRQLLQAMAGEPKVCRFLHLSLQHGSDRILRAMNRHYTSEEYADFAREARERIPGLHLGSDLIVGFPGETEADFEESCAFVERMAFANLHIFPYSPRPGTPAAELPGRVSAEVVRDRVARLRALAGVSRRRFLEANLGETLPVIFETEGKDGFARGWSDNYLAFRVPAAEVPLNRIVRLVATPEIMSIES